VIYREVGQFKTSYTADEAIFPIRQDRWLAFAALIFGGATALQYLFQAMGWNLPYQIFLALPYVLTLCGLAGIAGRVHAPASLGKWVEAE